MHFGLRYVALIDRAKGNTPKLGPLCGFVPKRRAARSTKHSQVAAGVKFGHVRHRWRNRDLTGVGQGPRRVARTREFSAIRAMTIPSAA
jgi:hypothetical protein